MKAKVPGVACGILEKLWKKFELKKNFILKEKKVILFDRKNFQIQKSKKVFKKQKYILCYFLEYTRIPSKNVSKYVSAVCEAIANININT